MDEKSIIKPEFKKELNRSEFLNELLEKEFKESLANKENFNNGIYLIKSFVMKNNNNIEMGFYVYNNSEKNVYIKSLPISIKYQGSAIKNIDLALEKNIEANKAIFEEIVIPISAKDKYDIREISISMAEQFNIKVYPVIEIDMDTLPAINGYKSYRDMKKFVKQLPTMEEDQLSIDVFKVGALENSFCIIALFRNSSDTDITIKSLPIKIYTKNEVLMYTGVYRLKGEFLKVEGKKGKLHSIIIPSDILPKMLGGNFEKCIVKFN